MDVESEYVTAEEAARMLGVRLATLYAYVSRKGVRSQKLAGVRQHRYWRADIERLRRRERQPKALEGVLHSESQVTLITERGPYYRGRSAAELAETASVESVAALLWGVDEREVFTAAPPRASKTFAALETLLADEAGVDRAIAHFPFLEQANPRAYDLSPLGMARSGADVVRWLAAIILRQDQVSTDPLHIQFKRALRLDTVRTDLARRLLILAADHGFEQGTVAVRVVAGAGVTPWRAVATGLAVTTGRLSKFGPSEAMRRLMAEILHGEAAEAPVLSRIRSGEPLPGFDSPQYPAGDPRARALFDYCLRELGDDAGFRRLQRALELAWDAQGARPSFALMSTFVEEKLGLASRRGDMALSSSEAPFLVGRAVGWIAHAIEQYGDGEAPRREADYRGRLPA